MSANRTRRPTAARTRRIGGDADGFTLLEVVVAVAIAALALVALFRVSGTGLFAVTEATRVDEAIERARSHLAAFSIARAPTDSEGDDGDGYRWRLSARPIATQQSPPSAANGAPATLYDVEVMVSWRGRGGNRSVALATQRIAKTPPSQ